MRPVRWRLAQRHSSPSPSLIGWLRQSVTWLAPPAGSLGRRLVLIPAMILALAGCSMQEGTQKWYDPTDGVGVDAGSIAVRNVVVVASDDGEATLLATLVNRGEADQLVSAAVDGVDGSSGIQNVTIPAGGSAAIGPDGNARVDVSGIETKPGSIVDVELQFEKAPRTTARTIVQENTGIYADSLP